MQSYEWVNQGKTEEEVAISTTVGTLLQKTMVFYGTIIFARRKFSPLSLLVLVGENFICKFFCPVLMIA